MAENSKIEWTDATWTPIRARNLKTGKVGWHCEHATTGCINCYSEGFNLRLGTGLPFKPGHRKDIEIFLDEKMLTAPLRWKKPRMVFVCSMTDAFADFVKDEWLDKMFAVMALCPQHTFQVLTKRPARMRAYMADPDHAVRWFRIIDDEMAEAHRDLSFDKVTPNTFLRNVWLGFSAERQEEFDERWADMREVKAAVTFVSMEPLLGAIFFRPAKPDWIICGGESGPRARDMHTAWARDIRDQCAEQGTAFFMKQMAHKAPIPADLMVRQFPR